MTRQRRPYAVLWLAIAVFALLEVILIGLLLLNGSRTTSLPVPTPDTMHSQVVPADRPIQRAALLEASAVHHGWTADTLRAAGDAWRRVGDTGAALRFWYAAVSAGSTDPMLYRDLATAYLEQRSWAEADLPLSRLITAPQASTADRAWALFQRGLIRLAEDPSRALADLREAAALESGYASAIEPVVALLDLQISEPFRLASTLSAASLFDFAAAVMERAVTQGELGDDEARGLAYAAVLTAQAGRRADSYVQRAFALRPDDYGVLFLSGLYWRLRGEYDASVGAFQAAAALDASDPIVYAELGYSYEALGDLESARLWLSRAAAFEGQDSAYADDAERLSRSIDDVLTSMGITVRATVGPEETPALSESGDLGAGAQAGGTGQDAEATPPADSVR